MSVIKSQNTLKTHRQLVDEGLIVRDVVDGKEGEWRPCIGGSFHRDPITGELSLVTAPTAEPIPSSLRTQADAAQSPATAGAEPPSRRAPNGGQAPAAATKDRTTTPTA